MTLDLNGILWAWAEGFPDEPVSVALSSRDLSLQQESLRYLPESFGYRSGSETRDPGG